MKSTTMLWLSCLLLAPIQSAAQPLVPAAQSASYKLKGDKALFPDAISDDGLKTYIHWKAERELPAIFAINEQGQEILIDGYMRGEDYTIDRIYNRFVFRLDKDVARATRQLSGER